MKKEKKRYYLISYCGTREKVVQTKQEYEETLKEVNNYNRRSKSQYLVGNITKASMPDGIHIIGHAYKKLTGPSTISELLEYTTRFTKEELANTLESETGIKEGYIPDINIAYLENKDRGAKEDIHYDRRIKYLPVFYKDDRKYLSKEYVLRCLKYHVYKAHFDILKGLTSELCFNKDAAEEVERMYRTIDLCEHQNYSLDELYRVGKALIEKYICEVESDRTIARDDKDASYGTSRRRLYDVGIYFKYCGSMSQKHSPVKYNEGPTREKREELRLQEEQERVKKLEMTGNCQYEQMSLF